MKKSKIVFPAMIVTSTIGLVITESVQAKSIYTLKGNTLIVKKTNKKAPGYVTFNKKLYKDGILFRGIYKSKLYTSGKIEKRAMFYKGKLYKSGKLYTGVYANHYYKIGKLKTGIYKGKYYSHGNLYSGIQKGILYQNGIPFTGNYAENQLMYVKGKVFTGTHNGVEYVKGKIFLHNGFYKGSYYQNGKLAQGYVYELNGIPDNNVYMKDGKPFTGIGTEIGVKGTIFSNGIYNSKGQLTLIEGKYYNGQRLASGNVLNRYYQDGILMDIEALGTLDINSLNQFTLHGLAPLSKITKDMITLRDYNGNKIGIKSINYTDNPYELKIETATTLNFDGIQAKVEGFRNLSEANIAYNISLKNSIEFDSGTEMRTLLINRNKSLNKLQLILTLQNKNSLDITSLAEEIKYTSDTPGFIDEDGNILNNKPGTYKIQVSFIENKKKVLKEFKILYYDFKEKIPSNIHYELISHRDDFLPQSLFTHAFKQQGILQANLYYSKQRMVAAKFENNEYKTLSVYPENLNKLMPIENQYGIYTAYILDDNNIYPFDVNIYRTTSPDK